MLPILISRLRSCTPRFALAPVQGLGDSPSSGFYCPPGLHRRRARARARLCNCSRFRETCTRRRVLGAALYRVDVPAEYEDNRRPCSWPVFPLIVAPVSRPAPLRTRHWFLKAAPVPPDDNAPFCRLWYEPRSASARARVNRPYEACTARARVCADTLNVSPPPRLLHVQRGS